MKERKRIILPISSARIGMSSVSCYGHGLTAIRLVRAVSEGHQQIFLIIGPTASPQKMPFRAESRSPHQFFFELLANRLYEPPKKCPSGLRAEALVNFSSCLQVEWFEVPTFFWSGGGLYRALGQQAGLGLGQLKLTKMLGL